MNQISWISLDSPSLEGNEKKYLNECIDSSWISWQGRFVSDFEEQLAQYCGTKYCLSFVNGTYSLVLALNILGIERGDEVIVPTLTMSAVPFAVSSLGAKVVWVDSRIDSPVLDIEDLKQKITSKTKAVICVHL